MPKNFFMSQKCHIDSISGLILHNVGEIIQGFFAFSFSRMRAYISRCLNVRMMQIEIIVSNFVMA